MRENPKTAFRTCVTACIVVHVAVWAHIASAAESVNQAPPHAAVEAPGGPEPRNQFRLAAGRLDSSVLAYTASLATNSAFTARSSQITNLARMQGFVHEATATIAEIVAYFNGKSLAIEHGTKGTWYAYQEDAARGVEYSYIFSSPTGVLLRATVRPLSPDVADRGYEMRFSGDGVLQAFLHGKEAIEFHPDGSPSKYYCVLENGARYSVKWSEAGEITEQRVQKPWSERRNPSKDIRPAATNANGPPRQR